MKPKTYEQLIDILKVKKIKISKCANKPIYIGNNIYGDFSGNENRYNAKISEQNIKLKEERTNVTYKTTYTQYT